MIFKRRTIGKFVTGTKAVNTDGSKMEPKTILLRSLCRIVPFEPFSALGNPSRPWHDKWSKTYVIDVKKIEVFLIRSKNYFGTDVVRTLQVRSLC